MGHVEDRWYRVADGIREATPSCGKGMRYHVRYTARDGSERSKSFADREKRSAEAFVVSLESDKLRGSYIDPRAGRITFKEYADSYVASQTYESPPERPRSPGRGSTSTRPWADGSWGRRGPTTSANGIGRFRNVTSPRPTGGCCSPTSPRSSPPL
jgi:hypothetical protein